MLASPTVSAASEALALSCIAATAELDTPQPSFQQVLKRHHDLP